MLAGSQLNSSYNNNGETISDNSRLSYVLFCFEIKNSITSRTHFTSTTYLLKYSKIKNRSYYANNH